MKCVYVVMDQGLVYCSVLSTNHLFLFLFLRSIALTKATINEKCVYIGLKKETKKDPYTVLLHKAQSLI